MPAPNQAQIRPPSAPVYRPHMFSINNTHFQVAFPRHLIPTLDRRRALKHHHAVYNSLPSPYNYISYHFSSIYTSLHLRTHTLTLQLTRPYTPALFCRESHVSTSSPLASSPLDEHNCLALLHSFLTLSLSSPLALPSFAVSPYPLPLLMTLILALPRLTSSLAALHSDPPAIYTLPICSSPFYLVQIDYNCRYTSLAITSIPPPPLHLRPSHCVIFSIYLISDDQLRNTV